MFNQDDIFKSYKEQTDFLGKLTKFYQHNLINYSYRDVREYLLNERKISTEMMVKFQIGYASNSNDLLDFITLNSLDQELLYKTGIFKIINDDAYDHFFDRIMFPLFDIEGSIIGFSGRIWTKEEVGVAKFVNSPDTEIYKKSLNVYGLNFAKEEIRQQGFVWIVEGIPDVIACHSAGIINTVSGGGTNVTIDQLRILKYFTNNIALCFDNDVAGKAALDKIKPLLNSLKLNFISTFITSYKDPDELLKNEGAAILQDVLKSPF